MKKILLLSICLLIGAWTLSAQQTIYIIDNETVENFDGSQLKVRTIRDYKITTKKNMTDLTKLLKTLPGAKVDAEGRITVNGQAVKRITINGRTYSVDTE